MVAGGFLMHMLINIDVPELAPAIDFYTRAFDLTLQRIIDGDVAELTGGSSTLYLLAHAPGTKTRAASRDYARHWTPVHLDFVVDDLAAATERAVQAGAQREGGCIAWRGSQCVTFADPFGHGFCLIQFSEATYTDDD
jgi:predicted enzyme related to lactoylglutathione lyase